MKLLTRSRKKRVPSPLVYQSTFAEGNRAHAKARGNYDGPDMSSFLPPDIEPPRRSSGGRRLRRIGGVMLLIAALLMVSAVVAVVLDFNGSRGDARVKPGTEVQVTIPSGATASDIADALAAKGVIDNKTIFVARLRLSGKQAALHDGTHTLTTGASFDEIVEVLETPPPAAPTYDLLVPEGFRITDIARHIDSLRSKAGGGEAVVPAFTGEQYLTAVQNAGVPAGLGVPKGTRSLEGFLFPATYQLLTDATAEQFVAKQLEAFANAMRQVDMKKARKANLTPYDVVIIASMIEREAQVAAERPLVASVIYNRLREGMTLGIDATIQYAVSDDEWKTDLTKSDLAIDSPYNSRKHLGLPPTPIANPGLSSLQAAANPADTDHLYYVAETDGSGKHFFTDSYDEFLAHQQ